MWEVLSRLEASALGTAMRESGPWTYGIVNLAHILGISVLFGSVVVLDLRLLGAWRRHLSLAAAAAILQPLAATALVVATASGFALLTSNATEYAGNPFLYLKFPAIAVALTNAAVLQVLPAWRDRNVREPSVREARLLAFMGGTSLAAWTTALSAGRLIGYW
jgi:hypothetical protein